MNNAALIALALGFSSALAAQEPAATGLTLGDAIRLALDRNQNIKVEAYAPGIARANWLTAMGQFDPSLTFGRNFTRSYEYPTFPEPLPSQLTDTDTYSLALGGVLPLGTNYSVGGSAENIRGPFNNFTSDYATFDGINITQPLLKGFGFAANLVNVRVARANRSISEWQYRQTVMDTVGGVVETYSNLLLARDQLRIAQASRDLGATLLNQNEKALKDGFMAQSDVITARAELASREDAILVAERAVRVAENQLRELMGESKFLADDPLPVVEDASVPPVTVDPAKDYQTALSNRPDYQAARLGIAVNRAFDASARNGLLPQVNFVGGYGYNGLDQSFAASRQMAAGRNNPSYSAGLAVTLPLTFAQARGTARAARLTLEQSEAALKNLEANIAVVVANDGGQIETARKRVVADRAAYDFANQALKDEEEKLRDGTSTTLAVIQSQQNLINSENSLAGASSAERLAVTAYDLDLGTILTRYNITLADK